MASEPDAYEVILRRQTREADKLATEHLMCRRGAAGHNWQPRLPDFETKLKGARAVALQCSSCHAIKRGVVSRKYGEWLDSPRIEYPEGYLIPRQQGQVGPTVSAQAVRAAFAKRLDSMTDDLEPLTQLT